MPWVRSPSSGTPRFLRCCDMAVELISTGVGEAASSDFTVEGGNSRTIVLVDCDDEAAVDVEFKCTPTKYAFVDTIEVRVAFVTVLTAPGTYRVRRSATSGACGVFVSD